MQCKFLLKGLLNLHRIITFLHEEVTFGKENGQNCTVYCHFAEVLTDLVSVA